MFERILVNLDGSAESEVVLPIIEKLVTCTPADVILLRVAQHASHHDTYPAYSMKFRGQRDVALADTPASITEREIMHYLEVIAERLRNAGATTYTEFSFDEPVTCILEVAQRYRIDLIAMSAHQRTGLDRLLHRSVTESVLHRAPCPLLIVRTPELDSTVSGDSDDFDGIPRN
jgi:nucleotide-binding universal stress UspA family protein